MAEPQKIQGPSFKVSPTDVENFAKVWTYKGINIILSPEHKQFATDFANVAIRSFVEFIAAQHATAQKRKEEEAKPLVTLA